MRLHVSLPVFFSSLGVLLSSKYLTPSAANSLITSVATWEERRRKTPVTDILGKTFPTFCLYKGNLILTTKQASTHHQDVLLCVHQLMNDLEDLKTPADRPPC